MTFQLVRGIFEARARQDLKTAGVLAGAIYFNNVGETPKAADKTYAKVSLSFANTVLDTVSCGEGVERLQGTINVEVFTPKNKGSQKGEDICLAVIKGWQEINKYRSTATDAIASTSIRQIQGPITINPDQKPHHLNVVSAVFAARL